MIDKWHHWHGSKIFSYKVQELDYHCYILWKFRARESQQKKEDAKCMLFGLTIYIYGGKPWWLYLHYNIKFLLILNLDMGYL